MSPRSSPARKCSRFRCCWNPSKTMHPAIPGALCLASAGSRCVIEHHPGNRELGRCGPTSKRGVRDPQWPLFQSTFARTFRPTAERLVSKDAYQTPVTGRTQSVRATAHARAKRADIDDGAAFSSRLQTDYIRALNTRPTGCRRPRSDFCLCGLIRRFCLVLWIFVVAAFGVDDRPREGRCRTTASTMITDDYPGHTNRSGNRILPDWLRGRARWLSRPLPLAIRN